MVRISVDLPAPDNRMMAQIPLPDGQTDILSAQSRWDIACYLPEFYHLVISIPKGRKAIRHTSLFSVHFHAGFSRRC